MKDKAYALIFNSFPNQMSKFRAIDRISEILPLSKEEAHDLAGRTPIIVLDELSEKEGEKLKDYFKVTGVSITLTNDNLVKKRCYRILWPNKPTINFEATKVSNAPGSENKGKEVLAETSKSASKKEAPSTLSEFGKLQGQKKELARELEKLTAEYEIFKKQAREKERTLEENRNKLSTQLEAKTKGRSKEDGSSSKDNEALIKLRAELVKSQTETEEAAKKAKELEKELLMTRSLEADVKKKSFESKEKVDQLKTENETLKESVEKLSSQLKKEKETLVNVQDELKAKQTQITSRHSETEKLNATNQESRKKLNDAADLVKNLESENSELLKREDELKSSLYNTQEELSRVEAEKSSFVEELKAKSELWELKEEEYHKNQIALTELTSKWKVLTAQSDTEQQKTASLEDELRQKTEDFDKLEADYRMQQESLVLYRTKQEEAVEEAQTVRSQIEKSHESLLRVSEERTQEKILFEKEIEEKTRLIEKQAEELRQASTHNIDLEQKNKEKDSAILAQQKEISELKDFKDRYTATRDKYLEYKEQAENKIKGLEDEWLAKGTQYEELSARAQDYEMQLESLKEKLGTLEKKHASLQVEEQANREYRDRFNHLEKRSKEVKDTLTADLVSNQEKLDQMTSELGELKESHNELTHTHEVLVKANHQLEVSSRDSVATRDKQIGELRKKNDSLERQLDSTQRQLKDYMQQLQQQETIQKRLKISNDISEKEAKLKILVEKQAVMEQQIHSKENDIKEILKEQEACEKEVVHFKQLQKHLLEQTKYKDKAKPGRRPPPQAPSAEDSRQEEPQEANAL